MVQTSGKRFLYKDLTGLRPTNGQDLQEISDDLYLAIEAILDGIGEDVILSGCVVTGTDISAGTIYIGGKIATFAGDTGISFPYKLKLQTTEVNVKTYADASNKATETLYEAVEDAAGTFIVTSTGGTRLENTVQLSKYSGEVDSNGTGWRTIAQSTGLNGRGNCIVNVYITGTLIPSMFSFKVDASTSDAVARNGVIFTKTTEQCYIDGYRLLHDGTDCKLEVDFNTDVPTDIFIEVININQNFKWEPLTGTLPTGAIGGFTVVINEAIGLHDRMKGGTPLTEVTVFNGNWIRNSTGAKVKYKINLDGTLSLQGTCSNADVSPPNTVFSLPASVVAGLNKNVFVSGVNVSDDTFEAMVVSSSGDVVIQNPVQNKVYSFDAIVAIPLENEA